MPNYDANGGTDEHRRLVVMNEGSSAYIAIGTPIEGKVDRFSWHMAKDLDRHDLMILAALCKEVAEQLPWVDGRKKRAGHPECDLGFGHDEHKIVVGNGLQLTCKGLDL